MDPLESHGVPPLEWTFSSVHLAALVAAALVVVIGITMTMYRAMSARLGRLTTELANVRSAMNQNKEAHAQFANAIAETFKTINDRLGLHSKKLEKLEELEELSRMPADLLQISQKLEVVRGRLIKIQLTALEERRRKINLGSAFRMWRNIPTTVGDGAAAHNEQCETPVSVSNSGGGGAGYSGHTHVGAAECASSKDLESKDEHTRDDAESGHTYVGAAKCVGSKGLESKDVHTRDDAEFARNLALNLALEHEHDYAIALALAQKREAHGAEESKQPESVTASHAPETAPPAPETASHATGKASTARTAPRARETAWSTPCEADPMYKEVDFWMKRCTPLEKYASMMKDDKEIRATIDCILVGRNPLETIVTKLSKYFTVNTVGLPQ